MALLARRDPRQSAALALGPGTRGPGGRGGGAGGAHAAVRAVGSRHRAVGGAAEPRHRVRGRAHLYLLPPRA